MDLQPDRLTLPAIKEGGRQETKKDEKRDQGNGGNGGGGGGITQHPFIDGLIQTLPVTGAPWSTKERLNWLITANSVFKMIYQSEDDAEITLAVKPGKGNADDLV